MLEVGPIDAFYGDSHILHGVSLRVGEGERVAILGRNGAGKSTLMKSVMNAGPRVSGAVSWNGAALGSIPSFRRARMGLQLVPEDRRIFGHLSVLENIRMAGHCAPPGRAAIEPREMTRRFPMLEQLSGRLGSQLSGGQQQMLAIARAAASRPNLLLLDEPTEGLAPAIVERLAADVRAICDEDGVALLLSEQNIWFARQTTGRVIVIDAGRVVFEGGWPNFDADERIARNYLAI
ncbi:ABC transporter ATP-binding protein [Terrarubrum flagellatum]|uniref:ABC transporter ATP-binding protein n=1 Tax=Terrirubrum flagellatum TaxID=2895980 RepID=UPI0031454AAE